VQSVAVVPAAGASQRMGQPKLLLPWGASTILGSTLTALRSGGVAALIVVTNGDPAVTAAATANGAEAVANRAPEHGMLSSIQIGLAAARRLVVDEDAVLLVCPADLPALRATTVAGLLAAFAARQAARPRLILPTWAGRRGHPLLLGRELWPSIERLDLEHGLRALLAIHASELVSLAVDDPGACRDVDTPADYQDLRTAYDEPSSGRAV
jgi:molybdenum cofactor cytidylyltransferase